MRKKFHHTLNDYEKQFLNCVLKAKCALGYMHKKNNPYMIITSLMQHPFYVYTLIIITYVQQFRLFYMVYLTMQYAFIDLHIAATKRKTIIAANSMVFHKANKIVEQQINSPFIFFVVILTKMYPTSSKGVTLSTQQKSRV